MNKLKNIASVSIDVFISQILETIHIIFNKKEFSYFLTVVGFIYFFFSPQWLWNIVHVLDLCM